MNYGRSMKPFFNYIPIGLINFGTFGVFSAKLSALLWHCESLVHGRMDLVIFPTKKLVFKPKQCILCILNMILIVKNLGNNHHMSIVGDPC